jgi:hypothetical protein
MALSSYGTLRFHLDANQETGYADAALVTSVTDRSGNGRTFTGESGPAMDVDGITGWNTAAARRSIYMDVDERLYRNEAGLLNNGGFTVLILMRLVTLPVTNNFFVFDTGSDSADSRKALQILTTGAVSLSLDGGGGSMPANRPFLLSAVVASGAGASSIKVDGRTVATGTISTAVASDAPMRIGHRFDATGPGSAQVTHLGAIAVYTTPLSVANELAAADEMMANPWSKLATSAPMVMG